MTDNNDSKSPMTETEYVLAIQRVQAELENFRKRTEKEKSDVIANANLNLISNLLPVLDNFELSLKYANDKGVEMIYNELFKVLAKEGLSIVDTNCDFDANIHEAIAQVPGDRDGKIVEVVQKGFLLNGRLLRASKVKVSRLI
ncbi:nucleotide exchange factor GrpE [Candidatus Pacearchaeota archaeon]|nr:nucleotide exchange factor GrpE [Candidatus Pacearchaeota archaeon]